MELIKGTYVGPLSAWKGKTAILTPAFYAQFDDRGQYTSIGQHPFVAQDWKVRATMPLFRVLAQVCANLRHAQSAENTVWINKWGATAKELVKEYMPSGSGFDDGTKIDLDSSDDTTLVFETSFHHMDEHGGYTCWTEHKVHVRPNLAHGFDVRVTGSNKNEIRDFISETFHYALNCGVNRDGV